jgi:hypothetical protein
VPKKTTNTTSNKASDGSSKRALASVKTVAKCLLQRLPNVGNCGVARVSGGGSGQPLE